MVGRIVQVVLLCFVVGVILAAFNTDALGLMRWVTSNFKEVIDYILEFLDWGGRYILLGAGVVLPIVAINILVHFLKRRRSGEE
ncbi:hypothetical protein O4H49_15665 [Kiloniella laminariae]|uniref:Integrase n=1 Tax=Kiloniella laminariae TaxID=454162 RepID=A0ABT4LPI8_9PROT|nr:hypothetical protein [Kiloniella laminariae]MCZ4282226.1 hypothetical protein [Kiloniella laminariae]